MHGRVDSLLEVGTGFHTELTVRTYILTARSWAVAAHLEPEILIIGKVLAIGEMDAPEEEINDTSRAN